MKMFLELHTFTPFCKELWNSKVILEDPCFFWVLLKISKYSKQSITAVSGKFLCTALLVLMQSIYTEMLFYFVGPENFALFYGGPTKNSEWYMFIWQQKLETCLDWGTFQSYYLLNLIVQSYYLYLLVCYCICIYCTY